MKTETQIKHTPGPWKVTGSKIQSRTTEVRLSTDRKWGPYATICGDNHDTNARLIAAAPELLEALREFLEAWDAGELIDPSDADKARAVLSRAEGRAE